MTRQEELVWAAAWALSLQRTEGRMQPEEQHRFACSDAAEAVFGMQDFAANERIQASMEEGETMLRQMAGEPDCFMQRKLPTEGQFPGVYMACEHPQVERCEACHVFGGWQEDEERCPNCGAIPDRSLVEVWGTVYACRCGSAWVGGAADPPEEAP